MNYENFIKEINHETIDYDELENQFGDLVEDIDEENDDIYEY